MSTLLKSTKLINAQIIYYRNWGKYKQCRTRRNIVKIYRKKKDSKNKNQHNPADLKNFERSRIWHYYLSNKLQFIGEYIKMRKKNQSNVNAR